MYERMDEDNFLITSINQWILRLSNAEYTNKACIHWRERVRMTYVYLYV